MYSAAPSLYISLVPQPWQPLTPVNSNGGIRAGGPCLGGFGRRMPACKDHRPPQPRELCFTIAQSYHMCR